MTASVFAQAPEKMSYQAVVRDGSNNLVSSTSVGIQISILQGSASGTAVYVETQTLTSNANGLVSLEIGAGTVVSGNFTTIDLANGSYFIKTETDPTGGTSYTITGTSQLLSVPYALHAKTAESVTGTITETDPIFGSSVASGITGTDTTYWNNKLDAEVDTTYWKENGNNIYFNKGNIGIGESNPYAKLTIADTLNNTKLRSFSLEVDGGGTAGNSYKGIDSRIYGTNGDNRAIQGVSFGVSAEENTGIIGFADSANINRAVVGASTASNTTVSGYNYGLTGIARGSEFSNIAVGGYAENGNTSTGANFGVSCRASSVTSGDNFGIYSEASNGGTNYAGYFNGDVTVTGTFSNPSDRKLKRDIAPLENALLAINKITPVTYHYRNDNKTTGLNLPTNLQYGFVAQELENTLPELVTKQVVPMSSTGSMTENKVVDKPKTNFEFKGINYIGLVPILVQGIKEQQTKITELENKLKLLEDRIMKLEN